MSYEPVETMRRHALQHREIYFVSAPDAGLIKIGVANSARRRLMSIRTDSPVEVRLLGTIPCSRMGALEGELHTRFDHLRVRGEWFRAAPELHAFINDNATAVEPEDRSDDDLWRMKCEAVSAIARAPLSDIWKHGDRHPA